MLPIVSPDDVAAREETRAAQRAAEEEARREAANQVRQERCLALEVAEPIIAELTGKARIKEVSDRLLTSYLERYRAGIDRPYGEWRFGISHYGNSQPGASNPLLTVVCRDILRDLLTQQLFSKIAHRLQSGRNMLTQFAEYKLEATVTYTEVVIQLLPIN